MDSLPAPRKKGPRPRRIRRIMLKPLTVQEEDKLLSSLEGVCPRDFASARMRRKLLLRQLRREKVVSRPWDLDFVINNLQAQKRKQFYFDRLSEIATRREPDYKKKLRLKKESESHDHEGWEGGKSHPESGLPPGHEAVNPPIPATRLRSDVVYFRERLLGQNPFRNITSPYTGRPLLPYIRRDSESRTLKMCLLEELMEAHSKRIRRPDANRWYTNSMIRTIQAVSSLLLLPALSALCSSHHTHTHPHIHNASCRSRTK
jgi:hypothetical protein